MPIKYKKFTLLLNEADHTKLVFQAEEFKKSMAECVRELIRKDFTGDIKEFNQILIELRMLTRNLSNNINQIAKKTNSNILLNELEEANKINEEITKIWQLLKS